jgi:hypothetical protein
MRPEKLTERGHGDLIDQLSGRNSAFGGCFRGLDALVSEVIAKEILVNPLPQGRFAWAEESC